MICDELFERAHDATELADALLNLRLAIFHGGEDFPVISAGEKIANFFDGEFQAAQVNDDPGTFDQRSGVIAIAGLGIDPGGRQKLLLLLEAKSFDGDAGDSGKITDGEQASRIEVRHARQSKVSAKGRVK